MQVIARSLRPSGYAAIGIWLGAIHRRTVALPAVAPAPTLDPNRYRLRAGSGQAAQPRGAACERLV
jgi:hypothetical protein